MSKKMVWHNKETVYFEYYSITEAIQILKELHKKYGDNAEFIMDTYPYSESESEYLFIRVQELETDMEYECRISHENKMKEWQEQRDKAEFERLSQKFNK